MEKLKAKLTRVGELASLVIEVFNHEALLAYYGLKSLQKSNSRWKKVIVTGKLLVIQGQSHGGLEVTDDLDSLITDVQKFVFSMTSR